MHLYFSNFLDSIVLILEKLSTNYPKTILNTCNQLEFYLNSMEIRHCAGQIISSILSNSHGLAYLAWRSDWTTRLIRISIFGFMEGSSMEQLGLNENHDLLKLLLIGFELIFKLETLHYVDSLIGWTRTKGWFNQILVLFFDNLSISLFFFKIVLLS